MGRRPGLNEAKVVEAAVELVNERGLAELSMAALAQKLQVRSPSLYNHIDGLEGLQRAMTLRGLQTLTATLQAAAMGRAGYEALAAVAQAYLNFARQQPGLYALTLGSTENSDPELQAAGQSAVEVALAVLRGYGLSAEAALHATRCLRSALHGFAALEMAGGFGLSLNPDESFEHLLRTLDCGFRTGFGQQEDS